MISIKEIESFKDYGRVLSISNGVIEAYVTIDIGPRVIRFGFVDGQNIMCSNRTAFGPMEDEKFQSFFGKGKKWENLGGHRIWLSPESYPETYYPDLDRVSYETTEHGAIFTPPAEKEIGVSKQMEIKMDADDANMQVIVRVKNVCEKPLTFAIWGLSVSAPGGTEIIPMNDNDTGLLSNRIISVWPYTDMSDSRIYWGKKYVTVKQDTAAECPLKLGFDLNRGTVHYVLGDDVFTKSFETLHPTAAYPDGGCSFETYTNDAMIEIESLGELKTVNPGELSELTEHWSLCKKPCDADFRSDASIENLLSKL